MTLAPSLRATLSRSLRHLLPAALALATATCTQDNVGPSGTGVGYFTFRPSYELAGGASLAQFGIVADSIHIRLTRPVDQLVLDTTVFFPADSTELHLALPIVLEQSPDTLDAIIEISSGGVVIFRDSIRTEVFDGPPSGNDIPAVVFDYVGPGTDIRDLFILPGDTTIFLGDTLFFTATAVDSSDADVPSFYVGWSTSDTSFAKINANGRLIAPNARGTVRVVGTTPTGIVDSTTVVFAPQPVIITADSGNGQSVPAGDSLPTLLVARIKAADSLGIKGLPVRFVAVTAGGAVADTIVFTDSTGRAKTRGYLGLTAGAYAFTATALGTALPAANFTATGTAAVPTTIAIVSGNAQVDTVAQLLPLPLVVHVTDAFNNAVPNTPVVFFKVFGDGTVGDDTVLTNASGDASIGYTLGISIGTDSITATIAGTSAFAIFNVQGIADTPVSNQEFGGGNQTVAVNTAYPESLLVKVFDSHDNPVLGAKVVWSIFSGEGTLASDTTLTDSTGSARNELTAGTLPGQLQVEARALPIANGVTITNFVVAGAPASMTIASGDGQSGPAGNPLPLWPEVRVADAFDNPVAGVTVAFAVVAGAGSIDSATATTDSTGRANSGEWTLGVAGLNTVRAVSAAVPADTLLFDATAFPAGTSKLWTGAVDNLWTTPGNWSPSGVPTITDNVFIPAGVTSPSLFSTSNTRDLTIESGATLNTGSYVLNISGDLDVGGTIAGAGFPILNGTGKTLRGAISTYIEIAGTISLSGAFSTTAQMTVSGSGTLTLNGHPLSVGTTFSITGSAQLVMTNAADSMDVGSNFSTSSGTTGTGLLSAGTLVLRSDFSQISGSSTNFAPSGTHTTRFLGAGVQSVNFTNPGSAASRFQNVEFGSPAGTVVTSTVTVMGIATASAGTVNGIGRTINIGGGLNTSYATWQVSTTLWGQNPTVYPDSLPRHVTVFGAWTLTKPFKTDSSLLVSSAGVLTLNGNALKVGTTVSNTGRIVMTNAADSLDVAGAYGVTSGVTSIGDLTNGVLVLRGNFSQVGGSSANFQPSGAHRTRFLGSSAQSVSFSNVGGSSSRFMAVEFGNPAGITLSTNMYVAGPAAVTSGTVTGVGRTVSLASDLVSPYTGWQVSNTSWVGTPSAYPDSLPRNLSINAAITLNKAFKVDSTVSIIATGSLTLNGHSFRIGGTFTQTGDLFMQAAADTLDVTGHITVNSGFSGTGNLSAGLIRVRGGFTQIGGASSNFAPSGGHLTRFEATGGQTVTFTNIGAAASRFQTLEVADSLTVTSGLYLAGTTTLLPGGKVQSTQNATLAGPLSDPTNLGWRYQNTTLSGTVTSLPDSLVTSVTLLGNWALGQRTRISGSLTIGSAATLDLNGDTLLVAGLMTQGGILASSDPNGALGIGGLLTVNSPISGAGSLTQGHLVLQNGLTQVGGSSSNFAPTVNFLTTFAGVGGHNVSFTNPGTAGSRFHHLEVVDSLTFTSNLAVTGNTNIDTGGRIIGATRTGTLLGALVDSSGLGWRVTNTSIPGGQIVPDSLVTNLTLTGAWTLPNRQWVDGSLSISSTGSLDLGAQRLDVTGAMTQSGELKMLQNEDTLELAGLLTVNSGQAGTGDLVDGVLILHGGFLQQSGASSNFAAAPGHQTWFVGTTGQNVTFTNPSLGSSHFQNVSVFDSLTLGSDFAAGGLVFVDAGGRVMGAGRTGILGASLDDGGQVGWLVGTTIFSGRFSTLPETLITNVMLQDSTFLPYDVTVTGDFTLQTNAYLGFGGNGLLVSGNFTQTGHLAMFATGDSLEVGGNFLVNSAASSAGDLVAGVIVLWGGFDQVSGASNNFVGASPHRVRFPGAAGRTVHFTNSTSMFGDLEIDGPGALTLTSDIRAAGTFKVTGPSTLTSPVTQRLVRTAGLAVDGLALDRVRVRLNSPASNAAQFDNVFFANQDPTLIQLSLEFPGQVGDTIKLNNVNFDGTPTTGQYVYAADSAANDAVANIGFYNSFPLNGALHTGTEGTAGDVPNVLWSHLEWQTDLIDGVELLPLLESPVVRAADPSGNPIPTYNGTVTLSFYTDPSAGAATLGGNVVAADGGVATFDALTISLAGAGYQLQANTPDLGVSPPSASFTISLPIPVGITTSFNNGGGDSDWFNGANWTFGVPDSADNIFIFPGQTVAVNSPASANRVELGTGAGILLNAPLTVDSSVVAGNTITGGGELIARGLGYLSGVMGGLVVNGNYLVPFGDTLTADFINISGSSAILDPGPARIEAIDSFRTEAGGRLAMVDGSGVVAVQGLARFTGGASTLDAGTLEIGGDFSQEENVGAFSPGVDFVTSFNGGGTQTATFFSPDTASDHFGELRMTGGGTLHLAGFLVPVLGNIEIQGGHVVVDTQAVVLGTITGNTGAFMEGAMLMIRDNFAFGGVYTVTNTFFIGTNQTIQQAATPFDTVYVQGTATLAGNVTANSFWASNGGLFTVGGHRLDVVGDFGTFQTGMFEMSDPADTVMVGGSFYAVGGPTTGLLTAGLLQVAEGFFQGNYVPCCLEVIVTGPMPAFNSFDAGPGLTTRLVGGSGNRLIFFANPVSPPGSGGFAGAASKFGTLEIVDGVDSLLSVVPVEGTTTIGAAALFGGTLAAAGPLVVEPGTVALNVASLYSGGGIDYQAPAATFNVNETFFFGGDSIPVLPYQWLRVGFATMALTGDLSVSQVTLGGQGEGPGDSYNGDLDLNGHALTVGGEFRAAGFGRFRMASPADSLDVSGSFDIAGGPMTGMVTDGAIVARSGVYLSPNWTDTSFVAEGNNRFVMAAGGAQDLWISQGPSGSTQFADFTITPGTTVNFNPYSNGALIVADSFGISGFLLQASPGQKVVALSDLYVGISLGITVDTVELHDELEVSGAGYSVLVTRYAGSGQLITPAVTYQDIQVTGTVALDSSVIVNHDVTVLGTGQLDLGTKELNVGRDFLTQDNGLLTMQDPADSLRVAYTAVFDGGDTDGLLTAGTIQANYFVQGATTTTRSFRASDGHRVELMMQDPADQGTIIHMASGDGRSQIAQLRLADGGVGSVPTRITGHVNVAGSMLTVSEGSGGVISSGGTLVIGDSLIVQDPATDFYLDTLELRGAIQVPNGTFFNLVTRFGGFLQAIPDTQSYQEVEVTGTAHLESTATVGQFRILGSGQFTLLTSQQLIVNGNFATLENGTLQMTGVGADLFIGGDALFSGGSSSALLGNGNIRVAGNFTTQVGAATDPFDAYNTGVTFQGGSGTQLVTLDPASSGNFRGVGIINPNGIQISGLLLVTDTVGTSGPISGDSLYQFGPFNLNASVAVNLKVFKTAGIFSGLPSSYTVGRTHITNPNGLPNVTFDTLVVNANGVSAFYPLNVSTLIIAANGSPYALGPDAVLDLGAYGGSVIHNISGDVRVEGTGARLEIAEDTMYVGGDFYTSLGGTLGMNGSGALIVSGSTLFGGGSQEGLMTSGTLTVNGGITQQAFSSPSSFRMDGTTLDLVAGPSHVLNFETADSSWLPDITNGDAAGMNLIIVGRVRVVGGISGNSLIISGDTLITGDPLSGAPSGLSVTLDKYEGPVFYQFQNVNTWTVGTTHFTGGGGLPYSGDFAFDTLIVSGPVNGQLSQVLTANYVEVTGPGNPRHIGDTIGELTLDGGDGNTDLIVSGDVVVRGAGAHISSFGGNLTTTGDFTVDQAGYFRSGGSFGGASWNIGGDALIDGTITVDSLVQGTLTIGGSFAQGGTTAGASFAPDSTFITAFTGAGPHSIFFATPSPRGSTGSYFGGLVVGDAPVATVIQMAGDYYVEGTLSTASSNGVTFENSSPLLGRLNVQDVAVQNITFDHLQLRLEKHSAPAAGAGTMDIVNFTNFQNDEYQFVVTLPGGGAGPFTWSNFSFTPLAASGLDTGKYVVATDWDGAVPNALLISLGTNQSGDPATYFFAQNGATLTPFSP